MIINAKTRKRTKTIAIIITLTLLSLAAAAAAYFYWGGKLVPTHATVPDTNWIESSNRINILLLGSDAEFGTDTRTDTIILASFDTVLKKISLLSIPRDTRVEIPGHGLDKINAANFVGGVELTKETIANLIKVPIDYYVLTNFDGFKGIIDTLGGVEIDVEKDMKYRVYNGEIDLKKGLQRLDGDKALQYVRFRHDKMGDISRTQRQQKFLAALAKEMNQPKNLVKLPFLLPQLMKAVETDLSPAQLVGLAREAGKFDLTQITSQTLPGNFATIGGVSYWVVDMVKTPEVVRQIFAGETKELIDTNVAPVEQPKKTQPKKSTQTVAAPPETQDNQLPPEQTITVEVEGDIPPELQPDAVAPAEDASLIAVPEQSGSTAQPADPAEGLPQP